jgi:hypothetical protein
MDSGGTAALLLADDSSEAPGSSVGSAGNYFGGQVRQFVVDRLRAGISISPGERLASASLDADDQGQQLAFPERPVLAGVRQKCMPRDQSKVRRYSSAVQRAMVNNP